MLTGTRFLSVPRDPKKLSGTLIPESANTVSHVYFSANLEIASKTVDPFATITDTKGNVWLRNGTIPFVIGDVSAGTPTGQGPWSDSNYWTLPASNTVLGFANDFCITIVACQFNNVATNVMFTKGTANNVNGWSILTNVGGTFQINLGNGATTTTTNTISVGTPFVASAGKLGVQGFAKINLGPIALGGANLVQDVADPAYIGHWIGGGFASVEVIIYEIEAASCAPDTTAAAVDAALNRKHASILSSMGIAYNSNLIWNGQGTI